MLPWCPGLCSRGVRDYVPVVSGIMLPWCPGLCSRGVRDYTPVVSGIMFPWCPGLYSRGVRDYAPVIVRALLKRPTFKFFVAFPDESILLLISK